MSEIDNIKKICEEKNVTFFEVEKACGFANGYLRNYKGRAFPADRLCMIALYLNVPLTDLDDCFSSFELSSTNTDIQKALKGPYGEKLIKYAKLLNEINSMESEALNKQKT